MEIFCGESGMERPVPLAEMMDCVSSPEIKYEMASVKSASLRMENTSPSSSVYASEKGEAERWKHSSTYTI
jgi:hypothetical protein